MWRKKGVEEKEKMDQVSGGVVLNREAILARDLHRSVKGGEKGDMEGKKRK